MGRPRKNAAQFIGLVFGELTLLAEAARTSNRTRVNVSCSCGVIKDVDLSRILSGATKSCGHLAWRDLHKNNQTHGDSVGGPTRLYRIWQHMRARCANKKDINYPKYGGRGITVCREWRGSFEKFRDDMGVPASSDLTLDRIDNDKGYSKKNCRWADGVTQGRNKRNNRLVEYQGKKMTIAELQKIAGIPRCTLVHRINMGYPTEQIMSKEYLPCGPRKRE